MKRRPTSIPAAAFGLLALVACGRSPSPPAGEAAEPAPAPARLAAGPHITCVTGAAPACAGEDDFQAPADAAVLATATALDFGLRHGCRLDRDGAASCWGDGSRGQLGVDPAALTERRRGRPARAAPAAVPGAPPFVALDAGWLHACGVTGDGAVWCWGDDELAQLGRPTAGPTVGPTAGPAASRVETLPNAADVSAGGFHSCAVVEEGGVRCWGDGSMGQLGGGAATDAAVAAAVVGLARPATAVSAGGYHSCARLDDGSVACWGDNRFGQLGDGTTNRSPTPVAVGGLSGPATAIAAGSSFTCALIEDGTVQCWGSDELGELGDGMAATAGVASGPSGLRRVEGLPAAAVRLVAGGAHACAELEGGARRCWGANEHGQLGDGTVEDRPVPVAWLGRAGERPRPPIAALGAAPEAINGIDVSYHSGRVDWRAAVARGDRFALTLATAGVDFRDPFLTAHWERMRQAGLVRGAYHFFVAGDDPEAQARHFLAHLDLEPGDLAPVVDLETRGHAAADVDLAADLRRFLAVVEPALGVRPILYTGPVFWQRNLSADFGAYPLWIAEYGVDAPRVPPGWERWHLWQWRGDVALPEIAAVVDLNRLHPDVALDELRIPAER